MLMYLPVFLSKIFISISSFIILIFMYSIQPLSATASTIEDQKQTYWYSHALQDLVTKGVLSNTEGFYPNKVISRGEFVQLIFESLDIEPIEEEKQDFTDVHKEDPYYSAVITLSERGVINGYSDGKFHPEKPLTRAQIAVIVSKAYNIIENDNNTLPFLDVNQNHWAFSSISKLYHADIVKGNEKNQYAPNQNLTWAEAIVVVNNALQYQDETSVVDSPSEEIKITDVVALNSDGRYLEVTFSQALNNIDKYQFHIFDSSSGDIRGVQEVQSIGEGNQAILTMYEGAALKTLRDYTIQVQANGFTTSYSYYRNEYIPLNQVTVTGVDVANREITVTDENKEKQTFSVPEEIEMDFVAAYNREVKIWHNSDGELTLFEYKNEEKDVKKKNKFISQYDLDEFLLVESIDGSIIKGANGEIDLKDFDVFVKSHKMIGQEDIQQGDLLLFNYKDGVVEVCTNIITGKIEAIYDSGIAVAGEVYDYNGYYMDSRGDLEDLDSDVVEDIKKNITLFLSKDDEIILVRD